ncbi:hypothetical protein HHK36_023277 [Tetracentron sinense]|uniref:Glycolipid transfer protein domain-containing protein n=1 Tax=Tetracentron sinense TaxID=13715 RepID=A0A835D7S0_TETSI|nr:hypothetical protein HHK36_023277 [Tetracentron sinense]
MSGLTAIIRGPSLKDPASTAYAQVFAPHHGWAIRKAVAAGMYVLPTKTQLLKKLNEDEATARIQMQNYIVTSAPVSLYIDKLFLSRELGVDCNAAVLLLRSCSHIFNQIKERKLNFIEARKLEIECLRLNLSAAERDRALLSIGTDRATINPNGLLVDSYMGRLCRLANTLALLGQAALEDKVTAAIGLGTVDDDDVIDFWNITGIGETCSGGMREVRAETEPPGHGLVLFSL